MLQLSKIMLIFVPSVEKDWRHRGELLSFDPSVNLENSSMRAKSLKAASPAVAFILLSPIVESAHINTCRCELIFILTYTGIAALGDEGDAFEEKSEKEPSS